MFKLGYKHKILCYHLKLKIFPKDPAVWVVNLDCWVGKIGGVGNED